MIIKMYAVSGMSCDGCVATVKSAIKDIPEVIEARVQLGDPQAIISMREGIPEEKLMQAVAGAGHYSIREIKENEAGANTAKTSGKKIGKVLGLFSHKKDCCK